MRIALVAGVLLAPLAAPLAGCDSSTGTGEDAPPVLEVMTPERGTMSDTLTLTVSGRASDDGDALRVTVNGVTANVAADGTFTASIDVSPGVAIVETRAIDGADHEVRDVRAVLAGSLAPATGFVDDGLGARIGASGFAAIGRGLGTALGSMNFTAAGQAVNPVYDNGGCLGATVNITSIDVGGVGVTLAPAAGSITTDVTLSNLVVHLHASYKVACLGGSRDLTIRASQVHLHGGLGLHVAGSDLSTSLDGVTVSFTGFDLDVGGLPDVVVNLFNGILDDRVASALAGAIRSGVPPFADAALADLAGASYSLPLLGASVGVRVAPSRVTIDAGGAFVALDTSLVVPGGEGASYLATPGPMAAELLAGTSGIGIAVADDAVNQLFAGLWGAGALDQHIPADGPVPFAALLDDETASLDLTLSLPPTMSTTDDILHLAIGDVIVTGRDAAGEELQRFAISITTTIAAATSPEGQIELALGPPKAWAQVLVQTDRVDRPLDADQLEDLVGSVWRIIGPLASRAIAGVPLPSIGGVAATDASVESTGGFVVLRANLVNP